METYPISNRFPIISYQKSSRIFGIFVLDTQSQELILLHKSLAKKQKFLVQEFFILMLNFFIPLALSYTNSLGSYNLLHCQNFIISCIRNSEQRITNLFRQLMVSSFLWTVFTNEIYNWWFWLLSWDLSWQV